MASSREIARKVRKASMDLHDALDQLGPKDVLRLKVMQIDYVPTLRALRDLRDLLNRLVIDEALEKGWRD